MTIVVEDGTGLNNSESYISVSDCDSYHLNRGNSSWSNLTTEQKEQNLRKATQYIDSTYLFYGVIYKTTQSLSFPREDIEDNEGRKLDNSIPQKIKDATCELALASIDKELISITDNSNYVTKQKVGDLEVEYAVGAPVDRQYRLVDRILSGLFRSKTGGGSTVKVDRV